MTAGEIFIVDGDGASAAQLAAILRDAGYSVHVGSSGARALAAIQSSPPDLVMVDASMPSIDGVELCHRLKADALTQEMPVVFLSAVDDASAKVLAFRAGASDYVTKPYRSEEIIARVENQLHMLALRRELERKNRELAQANLLLTRATRALESLSLVDPLTQLSNRRHFDGALEKEWRRSARERGSISLLMFDIDHFKLLNDTYGHQRGDDCLRAVARVFAHSLKRAGDLAARYGGEEFAIILPYTDADGGLALAEECRGGVESLGMEHSGSPFGLVTVSVGVASAIPDDDTSETTLVEAADRALYRAKASGRNRVCLAADEARQSG